MNYLCENYIKMKRILIFLLVVLITGCTKSTSPQYKDDVDSIIEYFASDSLTIEEAAEWDSMNADGGFLQIRDASRYLDTIVNHRHIVFIPEPPIKMEP